MKYFVCPCAGLMPLCNVIRMR